VLCFVYLLLFPFQLWGTAALIGVGAVVMSLLGRPDDIITTGITTTVVMVVAAISPEHAWKQPILRMVDTIVGIAVGVAGHLRRLFRRGDEHHDALVPQRSGDDGHPSDGRTDESVFTVCERRRGDLVHIDEDGGLALCVSDGGRGGNRRLRSGRLSKADRPGRRPPVRDCCWVRGLDDSFRSPILKRWPSPSLSKEIHVALMASIDRANVWLDYSIGASASTRGALYSSALFTAVG
jgi:hypothetical protein